MSKRDAYVEKLKAQLDEWNSELDKLEAEALKVDAEGRIQYERHIGTLRHKMDEAQQTLTKIHNASDDAWEELKRGAETTWNILKDSFTKTKSEFKRGYDEGMEEKG